jgi:hypothetical protein
VPLDEAELAQTFAQLPFALPIRIREDPEISSSTAASAIATAIATATATAGASVAAGICAKCSQVGITAKLHSCLFIYVFTEKIRVVIFFFYFNYLLVFFFFLN